MVNPHLHKPDNTALVHRLNKTLRDSKEIFDAWIIIYDVAVLDETLDGTLSCLTSVISILTECEGIGAKTSEKILEAYVKDGNFLNEENMVARVRGLGEERLKKNRQKALVRDHIRCSYFNVSALTTGGKYWEQGRKANLVEYMASIKTDMFMIQQVMAKGVEAVKQIDEQLDVKAGRPQENPKWMCCNSGNIRNSPRSGYPLLLYLEC